MIYKIREPDMLEHTYTTLGLTTTESKGEP